MKSIAKYIREDSQYKMFFSPFYKSGTVERLLAKDFDIHFYNLSDINQRFDTDVETIFDAKSYDELSPHGMTIYCDSPFNDEKFWNIMRKWSETNYVYILAYDSPSDFECVVETPKKCLFTLIEK
jgi:hypothetical protein